MKILHVCAVGFTVKNLLLPQIDYFRAKGFTVDVACSPGEEVSELQRQGYQIHPIAIARRIDLRANLSSVSRLAQLLRAEQYDLVHVHTPIASVVGRLAARWAGVQRVVYTAHGFPFHALSSPWEYRLYFTIEQLCAPLTDRILTQNYEDLKTAQTQGLCPPEKLRYLGNGIQVQRFCRDRLNPTGQAQLRESLGIPATARWLIGTIGRLTRKKGTEVLMAAAAKLLPQFPGLHILVIGGQLPTDPEPIQAQLLAQIQHLGLRDHVTLTGYRTDTPELLGLLDLFTLPSFSHEGLPRSILEAMAMALPVVTTDIRGCREAVVAGQTGLIVPPQDSDALATALATLLADPALGRNYGQAGRQRLLTTYDEQQVFQRLEAVYRELGVGP